MYQKVLSPLLIACLLQVFSSHVIARSTTNDNPVRSHAVSSQRLQEVMQNINRSINSSNDPDVPAGTLSEKQMGDLIEAVEDLLFHAELMTSVIPNPTLDEGEQVIFRALANLLYTEVLNLQQINRNYDLVNYDFSLFDESYHRLTRVCAA